MIREEPEIGTQLEGWHTTQLLSMASMLTQIVGAVFFGPRVRQ
jgi:hypothetical protein